MESGVKRYNTRSEGVNCTHMVEDTGVAVRKSADPHEKLKALLNSPEDDTDDSLPPSDAPKFGTVIHNRIFVGGFSLTTTDEDLWKFFSTFATVTAARVIYDRAGVSKCYGFVTFASPRVARLIVKQVSPLSLFYCAFDRNTKTFCGIKFQVYNCRITFQRFIKMKRFYRATRDTCVGR